VAAVPADEVVVATNWLGRVVGVGRVVCVGLATVVVVAPSPRRPTHRTPRQQPRQPSHRYPVGSGGSWSRGRCAGPDRCGPAWSARHRPGAPARQGGRRRTRSGRRGRGTRLSLGPVQGAQPVRSFPTDSSAPPGPGARSGGRFAPTGAPVSRGSGCSSLPSGCRRHGVDGPGQQPRPPLPVPRRRTRQPTSGLFNRESTHRRGASRQAPHRRVGAGGETQQNGPPRWR
jgi:hypothetical protein